MIDFEFLEHSTVVFVGKPKLGEVHFAMTFRLTI